MLTDQQFARPLKLQTRIFERDIPTPKGIPFPNCLPYKIFASLTVGCTSSRTTSTRPRQGGGSCQASFCSGLNDVSLLAS